MLQKVETRPYDLQPYREWVDGDSFEDLERLATRLRDLKVWHLNATSRVRKGARARLVVAINLIQQGASVELDAADVVPVG